ncbi:MAG: thiamine/thiamine pyrophosphate ABC transporter permease ThiP [Alphaproteobacteria bacterium]
MLRLFGLPLVVPVIVAVFGIVAVYGRGGWLNAALGWAGFGAIAPIYGLTGILIAHVFFNLPLAVRLLLDAWTAIPPESWRLANQLGLSSAQAFRFVEWPSLRQVLPGVATIVFFLCFTSFGVVLTLGGGPRSTIIEVAIYQALRLDFDVPRAVVLALVQLALCAVIGGVVLATRRTMATAAGSLLAGARPDAQALGGKIVDGVVILVAVTGVALPLAATVARAAAGPWASLAGDAELWRAALWSVTIGLAAGALAVTLGFALALGIRELRVRRRRPLLAGIVELLGSVTLVVSPLVLGAGLFVLALPVVGRPEVALGLVIVVDAMLTVPYAVRLLVPPMARQAHAHDRLCASLGIAGLDRFRLIDWPTLRRPAGLACALAAALAAGDLGAIALFGTGEVETLALRLYRQIAGYRLDDAAVTAAALVCLAAALFVVVERGVGGREHR